MYETSWLECEPREPCPDCPEPELAPSCDPEPATIRLASVLMSGFPAESSGGGPWPGERGREELEALPPGRRPPPSLPWPPRALPGPPGGGVLLATPPLPLK